MPFLISISLSILSLLGLLTCVHAAVTVYTQAPLGETATDTGAAAAYTGAAAYNPTTLIPPAVPSPPPATNFAVQLQDNAASVSGLSLPQKSGSFWGFSIEMSVINQVLGINASFIQVPFLNLMANLQERAGSIRIRVGGNTQETATMVDSLADGKMMEKDKINTSNPTETPALLYTPEVLYLLSNISSLVNVKWYLGVPLNDTANLRLQIATLGQAILGDNLLGLQVGNEPDLYAAHQHRPSTYGPFDYLGEFGVVRDALGSDPSANKLVGPSLATGNWKPEDVWNTGFIPTYQANLAALAMEHYPDDNCAAQFNTGQPVVNPQDVFENYLNHNAGKGMIGLYLNSTAIAQTAGKPFIMFETNTASCGGFAGISDSFASALWALDYGLQMAYSNFSNAFLHIGGQNVFYNPFTPPPTNQSTFHQWTIGPTYYATLIIAEVFGQSNATQIMDLNANNGSIYTPAYAIYDGGKPTKLALINFISDPSGASTYTAAISVGGSQFGQANGTPAQVRVKYLLAPSVSEKKNITWAGQTFGANFASDGRLQGNLNIETVTCDPTSNTCSITVPAPGAAVVFLTDDDQANTDKPPEPVTFSTTAVTKTANTATVDPSVLATSNGHSGKDLQKMGSTSKGSVSGAASTRVGVLVGPVGLLVGVLLYLSS